MKLEFFLSEKDGLAVLSFKGELADEDHSILEQSLQNALDKAPLGVAIHMAEVTSIPKEALRGFVLLLRGLKTKEVSILVSGLSDSLKQSLVQAGILAVTETRGSLPEALKDLAVIVRSKA